MKKMKKEGYDEIYQLIDDEDKNTEPVILIIKKEKTGTHLIDYMKFGFGFYVGFKLARVLKNKIVEKCTKK